MTKTKNYFLLFALFVAIITAKAQPATIPYVCDFENSIENARWIIPNSPTANRWVFGTAEASSPTHSAYISNDNGASANYSNALNTLPLYREFNTVNGEQYRITFNWKANGFQDLSDLRVYWVDNPSVDVSAWLTTGYDEPTAAIPYRKGIMHSTTAWQQGSFVVTGNGSPAKLVFVWRNYNFPSFHNAPGGCVDDIEIVKICPNPPTHVGITTDNISYINISWSGTGDSYDIRYRNTSGANTWTNHFGIVPPTTTLNLTSLTAGFYEIQVRANCNGGGSSTWETRIVDISPNVATIPYFHDFEDATENSKWETNSLTVNRWVIGTATSSSPTHSAYVSNNNGISADYSNVLNTIPFYREFRTVNGEQYLVTFDWKANGYPDLNDLRVYWVDNPLIDVSTWATTGYDELTAAIPYRKGIMDGTTDWQQGSFIVNGNGSFSKLVFVWRNFNFPFFHNAPGGCVDNVEITKRCPNPPTHIGINTDNASYVNISWSGTGDSYDVRYRNISLTIDPWTTVYGKIPPDTTLNLTSLPAGFYEVEVRANCNGGPSAWVTKYVRISPAPAAIPYYHDFEDSTENTNWETASLTENRWVIGTATSSSPTRSAYISYDDGVSADYTSVSNTTPLYREFNTVNGEKYLVTFDWKANGSIAVDELCVYWVDNPLVDVSTWATTNSFELPTAVPYRKATMHSITNWQQGSFVITGNGSPAKLVFMWRNSNSVFLHNAPGGCVDNVEIIRVCQAPPTHVGIDTDNSSYINISWSGTGDSFDVRYRNLTLTSTWTTHSGLVPPDTTLNLSSLPNGYYEIEVRVNCIAGYEGIWIKRTVIITDEYWDNCVDFTNLYSPFVVCTYGVFTNPHLNTGVVDFGPTNILSRHTVNTDINARDPRTGNGLRVIPQGEYASVRLGNWAVGAEAESITYDYTVSDSTTLIILRYAVVLEDPNHSPAQQPRFTLDILNQAGQLISPLCGSANFIPGVSTQGWNTFGQVVWKDWTSLGLSLHQYAGQTIKIRLTTYDCSPTAHYGYAYFTLSCASGEIQGASCGGIPVTFTAPAGFNYKWWAEDDPSVILSTTNTLTSQPNDVNDYICRVEFLEHPDCYFTLKAFAKNRLPNAAADYVLDTVCQNKISFTNQSYVTIGTEITGDPLHSFDWTVSDGQTSTEKDPEFLLPNTAGTYTVKLVAGLAERNCIDSVEFTFSVPEIHSLDTIIYDTICSNKTYDFNGTFISSAGTYIDTIPSFHGCDSIITLELAVNPAYFQTETLTINDNDLPYTWRDTVFDVGTTDGIFTFNRTTVLGCDSVVTLTLTVNPVTTITETEIICQNDLPYTWRDTVFDVGTISGTFIFNRIDESGGDSIVTLHLEVKLSPSVSVLESEICQNDTLHLTFTGVSPFDLDYTFNNTRQSIIISGMDAAFVATQSGGNLFIVHSLISDNGCSMGFMQETITVNPIKHEAVFDTICPNDSVLFNGNYYNLAGIYTANLQTAFGCDSIVTLNLTIRNDVVTTTIRDTICDNQTYLFNGTNYSQTGTYIANLQTANGCDSIVTLHLVVHLTYDTHIHDTICDGQSYLFNGQNYYVSGIYPITLLSINNCDSIVTLHLKVNEIYSINIYDTICQGETYDFNGTLISSAGTYTETLQTINGCDSIVTLQLEVIESIDVIFAGLAEICADYEDFTLTFTSNSSTFPTHYQIIFNQKELNAGFINQQGEIIGNNIVVEMPDKVYPDYYSLTIILSNDVYNCDEKSFEINYSVLYPSSIMEQKWDDVIALLNEQSCGYKFVGYQWHQNGEEMLDENKSYIYRTLVVGDEYSVLITREDGTKMLSCPLEAIAKDCCTEIPTIVQPSGVIKLQDENAQVRLITVTGIPLSNYQSAKNEIIAPMQQGVYLLEILLSNNSRKVVKIIVK